MIIIFSLTVYTYCFILISSPGSVLATVELLFDRSSLDNNLLGRLSREIEDEKLGPFTVDRFLYSSNPGLTEFSSL